MPGTPIDSALILRAEASLTSTATSTAIDVEGGSDAEWFAQWALPTGTTPTLDLKLEVSVDGGANYKTLALGRRQYVIGDAPAAGQLRYRVSQPVFIPRPTGADAYSGSQLRAKVRVVATVTGTSPVFPNMMSFLGVPTEGADRERESL